MKTVAKATGEPFLSRTFPLTVVFSDGGFSGGLEKATKVVRNRTVVIKNFLVFLVNRFSIVNVLFYDAKIYDGEKYLVPYILGYFFEIVIIIG